MPAYEQAPRMAPGWLARSLRLARIIAPAFAVCAALLGAWHTSGADTPKEGVRRLHHAPLLEGGHDHAHASRRGFNCTAREGAPLEDQSLSCVGVPSDSPGHALLSLEPRALRPWFPSP